jgi:tRNA splicing endonuclease
LDKESFEKLIKGCAPDRARKGVLLYNGAATCATAYQKDPSAASLKNMQAAEAALDEFVSLVKSASAERPSFGNKYAVFVSLKEDGLKVGKSKLYKDAEKGLLRVQPDGSVLLSDVELYKRAYLTPKQKAGSDADIDQLQKEKLELESNRLREQIAKLVWDREKEAGRYLLRSDFEMELAARAAVLETSLRQMAQTKAYDWIAVCKGEHSKAPDMAAMVTAEIGAVLNDYASTERFQVIFVEKENLNREDAKDAKI